jgi:hypothetical protein
MASLAGKSISGGAEIADRGDPIGGADVTGPHFGIIPRRVAGLRLPGRALNVLIAIASRANKDRITPPLSRDEIATEVGIDRSKVRYCLRRLEAEVVLEVLVQGGGRERANVYRIIPDEEALPRAAAVPNAASPVTQNGAVSGLENTIENGAIFASETGPFLSPNGAVSGPPTERTDRTEPPLRGGRARTSEGDRFRSGSAVSEAHQSIVLRPNTGAAHAPKSTDAVKNYRPSLETLAWAANNVPDLQPLDPDSLGRFKDYHLSKGTILRDLEAAYRCWLSRELEFRSQRGGHARGDRSLARGKQGPSSLLKNLLAETGIEYS